MPCGFRVAVSVYDRPRTTWLTSAREGLPHVAAPVESVSHSAHDSSWRAPHRGNGLRCPGRALHVAASWAGWGGGMMGDAVGAQAAPSGPNGCSEHAVRLTEITEPSSATSQRALHGGLIPSLHGACGVVQGRSQENPSSSACSQCRVNWALESSPVISPELHDNSAKPPCASTPSEFLGGCASAMCPLGVASHFPWSLCCTG